MYWTTLKKFDTNISIKDSASVAVDDLIYLFNGGLGDNEPIDIYVLNTYTLRLSLLPHPIGINGEQLKPPDVPSKRMNHTVVAYGKKIYLWGGKGTILCNILYCFDTITLNWSRPKVSGIIPSSRIFHSACIFDHLMYVFGGYDSYYNESTVDVPCLDLKTMNWSYIKTTGETPSRRRYIATIINDRMYIFGTYGEMHKYFMYLDLKSNSWNRQETTGKQPCMVDIDTSLVVHNNKIYVMDCFAFLNFNYLDIKRNHWNLIKPRGKLPKLIPLSPSCVIIGDKMFFFARRLPEKDENTNKLLNVIHVLDFNPSLQTLAIIKIIKNGLNFSCLPIKLRSQIDENRPKLYIKIIL